MVVKLFQDFILGMRMKASTVFKTWQRQTYLKSPESLALFHHIKVGLGEQVYWAIEPSQAYTNSNQMNLVVWEGAVLIAQSEKVAPELRNCEIVIGNQFSEALKACMNQRGISCYIDSGQSVEHSIFLIESAMGQKYETVQLNEKLQQNQSLSQYKSVFFSSICHELKNPLNGISVAAEMLTSDMDLFRRKEYLEEELS